MILLLGIETGIKCARFYTEAGNPASKTWKLHPVDLRDSPSDRATLAHRAIA